MGDQTKPLALVTGGAKRVGRAIVEKLAGAGYDIAFTYLGSEAEANSLVAELNARGVNAVAIKADLTRAAEAVDIIRRHVPGDIHVLVNNASLYTAATLAETTLEISRRMMAIHYESPLLLTQLFADRLRSSRGHVINMVDLQVERPVAKYLPYCASKAALANLTLTLARELAPEVTVNGIAPGVVEWPDDYPAEEREKYLRRVPLIRPGTPGDVAGVVHFLCTEGSYITGQVIRLDGGRSIT